MNARHFLSVALWLGLSTSVFPQYRENTSAIMDIRPTPTALSILKDLMFFESASNARTLSVTWTFNSTPAAGGLLTLQAATYR